MFCAEHDNTWEIAWIFPVREDPITFVITYELLGLFKIAALGNGTAVNKIEQLLVEGGVWNVDIMSFSIDVVLPTIDLVIVESEPAGYQLVPNTVQQTTLIQYDTIPIIVAGNSRPFSITLKRIVCCFPALWCIPFLTTTTHRLTNAKQSTKVA